MGPTRTLCCYPTAAGFAQAHADAIMNVWREGGAPPRPRVLFSAHGLPKRVIAGGDPYQWQVEQTAKAVSARLPADWETRICYQSRVGPLEWIGPSTEAEIEQAGHDGQGVIVTPIAFVSEHVETLVELDIDYARRASALPYYLRADALGVADGFIALLADEAVRLAGSDAALSCQAGRRLCPASFAKCPLREDMGQASPGRPVATNATSQEPAP
jgi:ferrochelatase